MSISRNVMLAMLPLVMTFSPGYAQNDDTMLELNAVGEITFGPDGHVLDYQLKNELSPQVAQLVDRSVRQWVFEPIQVNGAPVAAKTAVHLRLQAVPTTSADNYRVSIASVTFDESKRSARIAPPKYPKDAVRVHAQARVLLSVHVDDTGQVVDVQPYETSLDARTAAGGDAERWRKEFEQASIGAAKQWHYTVTQTVDGKAIGNSVIVPVTFSLCEPSCGRNSDSDWKTYVAGPVHPAPWMKSAPFNDGHDFSSLHDGEALPLDSAFRLKSDVIGKSL